MRYIFMNEEITAKINKNVNAVISLIHYDGMGMVSTDSILSAVRAITDSDISFSYASFSEINVPNCNDIGAMMCVYKGGDAQKQTAEIILNKDKDAKFRRFSLIHELGHLVNGKYTVEDVDNEYTLSAHINYKITSFSEEDCKDPIIEREECANIFALKVLMPWNTFIKKFLDSRSFTEVSDFFGVSEDAVKSRALLGV